MFGGRGGRPAAGSTDIRDLRPVLVRRFDLYVSRTMSFSFFGELDEPPLAVPLFWLSKSSSPVGSFEIPLSVSSELVVVFDSRRTRIAFLTIKTTPTISGIVIAQIIKIKTGKGMMKASKSFSQIKISIEVGGQDNETKTIKGDRNTPF